MRHSSPSRTAMLKPVSGRKNSSTSAAPCPDISSVASVPGSAKPTACCGNCPPDVFLPENSFGSCYISVSGTMEQRLILIDLLIKLGMASLLASGLIRSVEFKSLLYRNDRSLKQRFYLVVWLCFAQWLGIFL